MSQNMQDGYNAFWNEVERSPYWDLDPRHGEWVRGWLIAFDEVFAPCNVSPCVGG